MNLLSLWPANGRSAPAAANNFTSTDNNVYDSYNGVAKIDHAFNSKYSVSARYFGGTGDQTANDGSSPFLPYYQAVPSRMHNVSVVPTAILSPNLVNQLVLGYNYFYQTFDMNDAKGNPAALGLNTGLTDPEPFGPPRITISGFGIVGGSSLLPAGRIDATFHVTDTLSYSTGAHQIKVGGEYRRAKLDIFYESLKRGALTFDGTVGPWGTCGHRGRPRPRRFPGRLRLRGLHPPRSRAARLLSEFLRSFRARFVDGAAHPDRQFRSSLHVPGLLGTGDEQLTNFLPDKGLVQTDQLYP